MDDAVHADCGARPPRDSRIALLSSPGFSRLYRWPSTVNSVPITTRCPEALVATQVDSAYRLGTTAAIPDNEQTAAAMPKTSFRFKPPAPRPAPLSARHRPSPLSAP